ncbi:hypothetical protein HG537_0G01690 [Torulaspora globosa]|uniref:Pre-mRNA-splicing factor CWC2 n=1 Tax=Torulaspora globosa TaxID=48254 RepID=A0A7H9HZB3_9SACH|nr:hypothetical protein HG537_0G01690 [Torulaspora sp. CBS 2947]
MSKEKSWRDKPAKVQVPESELPSSIPSQTGLVFNIWYNKWSQGSNEQKRFVSPYRLDPKTHPGVTRGDKDGTAYFCLYFAKGMCCMGRRCQYMHHIPEDEDHVRLALKTEVLDCFGREKHGSYREDMGGVGSFRKANRTLYIGGLSGALNNKELKPSQIEGRIRFMFGSLGAIDRVRYVENKNCAFVKFKYTSSAEFAKEAMSNQTLLLPSDKEWEDRKEGTGLLCKWANDDPDPEAKRREEEAQKQESVNMMVKLLSDHLSKDTPLQGEISQGKRIIENNDSNSSIFSKGVLERLKKRKTIKHLKTGNSSVKTTSCISSSLMEYSSSDED